MKKPPKYKTINGYRYVRWVVKFYNINKPSQLLVVTIWAWVQRSDPDKLYIVSNPVHIREKFQKSGEVAWGYVLNKIKADCQKRWNTLMINFESITKDVSID